MYVCNVCACVCVFSFLCIKIRLRAIGMHFKMYFEVKGGTFKMQRCLPDKDSHVPTPNLNLNANDRGWSGGGGGILFLAHKNWGE